MQKLETATRVAGDREAGAICPACQTAVTWGTPVAVCRACGAAHHQPCWERDGVCAAYECAPARRELAGGIAPAVRITSADIAATAPLPPPRPVYSGPAYAPPPEPRRPRTSRLAISSLVCAVAGIPLFGLITGLVAVVLGCLALGGLRTSRQRGLVLATVGVLLGVADMVGWLVFLAGVFRGPPAVMMADFQPDVTALEGLDAKIGRAMRANVLIQGRTKLGVELGSGVILRIADGQADVLTNRHVADPDFTAEPIGLRVGGGSSGSLTVQMVGQAPRPGALVWVAPEGVDLALVRVPCTTAEARASLWAPGGAPKVGDPVFAIGNPHGLGWTHTQGTISQFRVKQAGSVRLRVIQMQTAVNPGNSGGGLYDADGRLVGIVTWSQDKRVSEGLNFAIGLDSVRSLLPDDLVPPEEKGGDRP